MLSDFYRHKIPNLWCTVCSEPSYFSLKAAFKFLLAYAVACQQMYCTVDENNPFPRCCGHNWPTKIVQAPNSSNNFDPSQADIL